MSKRRGNRAKKGEPGRPAHVGFQPGHAPFYNGGSVAGHAPTSDGSQLPKGGNAEALKAHRFMKGHKPENNGMPATARQRECLESVQNLEDLDDIEAVARLKERFPLRMILHLIELQRSAEDPDSHHFLQSQRLIREILIAPKRRAEIPGAEAAAQKEPDTIRVIQGRINAELPGAAAREEQAPPP